MQQFDLIIVGGGLAGASLALALRDSRLRIALVENQQPRPALGWDARVYAVSPVNAAFWSRLVHGVISTLRVLPQFAPCVFLAMREESSSFRHLKRVYPS